MSTKIQIIIYNIQYKGSINCNLIKKVVNSMLKDLFVNMTILITFIFIWGQIYRNEPLNDDSSLIMIYLSGILGGILGCILMIFSIHVGDNTILDLRHVAIILSGIYGGIIPTIISSIIISIFRVAYFGINTSSVTASINMLNIAIVCSIILKSKLLGWKKWVFMNLYALIAISISLVFLLENRKDLIYILANYCTISIFASGFVYYLVWYVKTSNEMFIRLKEESLKDFLTGLNNVREFDLVLNRLINRVKEYKEKLSILIIDIDHFKKVNDTYGHNTGDLVLQELGKILASSCRTEDIASRIGGEEFAILLPNCAYEQALEVAEIIRRDIENHKFVLSNNTSINITVSIGLATYSDTVENLDELVIKADEALYKAKQTGRNKICACI